ncbi:unnamed protein product, partial [Didymodactylos carnosus]
MTSVPNYQKMTKEKFLHIVELMGKVSGTKQLLDQLSDASLAIWDTLLHEIEFSQLFNREITTCGIDLNEDGVEKTLLFLNRIRIQLGNENYDKFLQFFRCISKKIAKLDRKSIKPLNELLKAVHYQKLSFEQANDIVLNIDYIDWPKKIKEKESDRYRIDGQSDHSAREIIDQMITKQKDRTN